MVLSCVVLRITLGLKRTVVITKTMKFQTLPEGMIPQKELHNILHMESVQSYL